MSTKADSAYRQLRDLIQKGSVSPGERITEALAAKMVGMGRGPVRESLLRLEAEGWLRHKGEHQSRVVVYVEDQDPREMLFRYELREQIEGGAARLAAKTLTGWEIDRLRDLARAMEESRRSSDREASYRASREFHHFLLSHCGNPLLMEVWKAHRLAPPQPRSGELDQRIAQETSRMASPDDGFMAVVEAIAAHDPDGAETLMKRKIRDVTEVLRAIVMEQASNAESGLPANG